MSAFVDQNLLNKELYVNQDVEPAKDGMSMDVYVLMDMLDMVHVNNAQLDQPPMLIKLPVFVLVDYSLLINLHALHVKLTQLQVLIRLYVYAMLDLLHKVQHVSLQLIVKILKY